MHPSQRGAEQRTEFRYRNLFNNSVETIIDCDQVSLAIAFDISFFNFLFTPSIVFNEFNWNQSRYIIRDIREEIFFSFFLPFLLEQIN